MNILIITYPLNGLLMIGMPIALGIWLTRRFHINWQLFWIGAATFVFSQIGHIPFNTLLNNLFLNGMIPMPPESWRLVTFSFIGGLSAGVWEETSRYIVYRWWAKDARTWEKGVLLGAGHGGIEAIILGLLVLFTFVQLAVLRSVDITTLVAPEQLDLANQQISAYWATPWSLTLLGAVERAFTIPFHIACSVLILQVFTRRQTRWLWFAIAYHTFVDAIFAGILKSEFAPFPWGPYALEGLIGVSAVFSIGIIIQIMKKSPPVLEGEETPQPDLPSPPTIQEIAVTEENLENTRYN